MPRIRESISGFLNFLFKKFVNKCYEILLNENYCDKRTICFQLTDETDIFICLVCRYSIDLLFDLQTVSEEVSEKLHKIIDEGIKVDKLSKVFVTN